MLINVRGAFGSGKSTIVNAALDAGATAGSGQRALATLAEDKVHSPTKADPQRIRTRILQGVVTDKAVALGSYGNTCGGADEYSWRGAHDAICRGVLKMATDYRGQVGLYEGVTIAGIYQRYVDLSAEVLFQTGRRTQIVFVMPAASECLQRVSKRSGKEINPRMYDSVFDKWRAVQRAYERMKMEAPIGIDLHYFTDTDQAKEFVINSVVAQNV